jgi:bifunctional non-homologous end joining protein LigD
MFGSFFAQFMTNKYPELFTIERLVKNRGKLIYFDYLQHWTGKTLIAPYSLRGKKIPIVSAPLEWSEVPHCHPSQYVIQNMLSRIEVKGDLFAPLLNGTKYNLHPLLKVISPTLS